MKIAARPGDRGQAAVSPSVLRRRSGRTLQAGPHGVKVRKGLELDEFHPSRFPAKPLAREPVAPLDHLAQIQAGGIDDDRVGGRF